MDLREVLLEKRSDILSMWSNMIMDQYPPDAAVFYKTEKDRFLNPLGYIVNEGLESIYDWLLGEGKNEDFRYATDRIMRVMAVQDISPSKAISLVFMLKKILKEAVKGDSTKGILDEELNGLYEKIDEIALVLFDMYMGCREDIHRIRMGEMRKQNHRMMKNIDVLNKRKGL
ncbi:MAG: RsbRD N-terminal domain-containing protein [Syntrophorhabdaceae bacterium]|nr:RsbRD N-terminal domain-containing protein [Syntrophorhabdaceae bacterium]